MQAAALLGRVAQRSQEHDDELAAALVRVQKSLSAALFDDASETQYGSLVGLIAFGVPTVLSTVVPKLHQYCQKLKGDSLTAGQLQVRAALVVALGRCMTWSGASEAPAILQAVQGTWLEDALHAVQPAALAFL
jgi:Flp pilus assembly pilin Flp